MNRASRSAPLCKSINEPRTIHLSRPQGTIRLTSIPFGSMQRRQSGGRRHRSGGFAQGIHGIGWFRGRKRLLTLALQDCMQLPVRPSAKGFGSCRHVMAAKLQTDLSLECSICVIFLNSSLTLSMIALLRSSTLSEAFIRAPFILLFGKTSFLPFWAIETVFV